MKTTYRVEHNWPHSPNRWAWVPEHANLTLKRAKDIVAKDKVFEREGMKQRIVASIERVVLTSRSRLYSPAQLAGIRNLLPH